MYKSTLRPTNHQTNLQPINQPKTKQLITKPIKQLSI